MSSYRFDITVKNGVAVIEETGGELPEGSWNIGGYEDEFGVSINVTRRLPNGMHVSEAHHHVAHRNYDHSKFEDDSVVTPGPSIQAAEWHIPQSVNVGPDTPADGIPKIYRGRVDQNVSASTSESESPALITASLVGPRFADGPVQVSPDDWRNYEDGPSWLSIESALEHREYDIQSVIDGLSVTNDARAPYSVDIPLPEGERYPDNQCRNCGRIAGESDPCDKCPDVTTIRSVDEMEERVAHQPPVIGDDADDDNTETKLNMVPEPDRPEQHVHLWPDTFSG